MAILGIGSNIGNKYINILLALELLSEYGTNCEYITYLHN